MKKIISKSNISKILGAGAVLGLFLSMLIVSPVFPKTANAGWITSNIFGGGNHLTDDILGIDPVPYNNYNTNYYYDDYDYDYYRRCGNACHPTAPIHTPIVPTLIISCNSNISNADINDDVTWRANASGGTGSYSYSWSGTNGLSGNNRNVVWSYDTSGTKRGTVTVTSNGQSASASCSMSINQEDNYDDDDLDVSCYANPSNPQINNRVNWYADVSGGNGNYTYSWRGSDGLNSSSRSPYMTYSTPGSKSATITVRSNGRSTSANCYTNVVQNSVLSFSQSYQTPLASAVYLSQIPSTGVYDNMKLAYFVGFLALFSAWVAYVVISYKKNNSQLE